MNSAPAAPVTGTATDGETTARTGVPLVARPPQSAGATLRDGCAAAAAAPQDGAARRPESQEITEATQESADAPVVPSTWIAVGLSQPPGLLEWRTLLRSCRSARNAAYLGPTHAARTAVEVVREADACTRIKAKALLASQAAKNEFLTDLRAFDRFLQEHDEFLREMAARQHQPPRRLGVARPKRLPVDAARSVPLDQLLQRYGVDLRARGARLVGHCPFHDDARPSLQVTLQKGVWHCFPCGLGGDGITFVMRLKGLDFAQAVREVVG